VGGYYKSFQLGTLGAYVARVASRVLTSEDFEKLKGLEEGCLGQGDINADTSEKGGSDEGARAARQSKSARNCVLKVLNTRYQYLEVGKHVPLGLAEPLRWTPAVDSGGNLQNSVLTGAADLRISSMSGRNYRQLREKREQLEWTLEYLSPGEKQILLLVID
jgi:hypothetical protein